MIEKVREKREEIESEMQNNYMKYCGLYAVKKDSKVYMKAIN